MNHPVFLTSLRSVVAMKNYASTLTIGNSKEFLSFIPFTIWPGKRDISRDEDIKAAFGFLLRHVERVMSSAEPLYEALDNLQELLAHYQRLLEDPSAAKIDVFAELWTKVYGSKRVREGQLELLKDLKAHRGKLLGLVTATLKLTMAVIDQLEEMRKGIAGGIAGSFME